MDSACDRNECTVARMSLVVRRFTQITLTVRVTLNEIPLTSRIPMLPMRASGAKASTPRPRVPMRQASAYNRRAAPALDAGLDDPQRDGADREGCNPQCREPQDRVIGEAQIDELPREQPGDHACPIDDHCRGEHEQDVPPSNRAAPPRDCN